MSRRVKGNPIKSAEFSSLALQPLCPSLASSPAFPARPLSDSFASAAPSPPSGRLLFPEESDRNWSTDDFEIGPSIGAGKFSQVFVAREKKCGYIVALKRMAKPFLSAHGLQE